MSQQHRRTTRQRTAVADLLRSSSEFRSAQDIHAALRDAGDKVGLATVYRTLQGMAQDGAVDVLRTDEGEALYRRCSDGHHHHLLCRECGTAVEIEAAEVEAWTERVSRQHGFRDVDHTVEIIGICEACADAG